MNANELKKIIKDSVREVMQEDKVLKGLVSESIDTSIQAVFRIIAENKDLFTTKEIIRESVVQPVNVPSGPRTAKEIENDAILKFRNQQVRKQAPDIQKQLFGNHSINPQQVVNETKKVITQPQQITSTKINTNYLDLISQTELEDEDYD